MKSYLDTLNELQKEYFHILSNKFPKFLLPYIESFPMQRIEKIGCDCGTGYTKLFHYTGFYNNLDHSVGVALIVWNFTKDKKQTLAALFHDIATPVFKHAIDFMNQDYDKQESTEDLTIKLIQESEEIGALLKKEGIPLEEVANYHDYPIADNDTPKLSADRLEYTFGNGIYYKPVWTLERIRKVYEDIQILENEETIEELGFKHREIAEDFIQGASELWPNWISNKDKIAMQFIADITKKMIEGKYLCLQDLYTKSEKEIVEGIRKCPNSKIANTFKQFEAADYIIETQEPLLGKYGINLQVKRRYIIPLVQTDNGPMRIDKISDFAQEKIQDYLAFQTKPYACFDFNIEE